MSLRSDVDAVLVVMLLRLPLPTVVDSFRVVEFIDCSTCELPGRWRLDTEVEIGRSAA
jgi:hypothetical protein